LRQDLAATLSPLIQRGVNLQRLILVTDSMTPDDVEENGHMDHVLRRAVSLGLPPMQAIQAVTLNAATYSGLEQEIGGIAPGRFADVVLLEDLESFQVRTTLISGKVVAKKGASLVSAKPISLPDMKNSLRPTADITPRQFKVKVPYDSASAKIRVMELVNQTITVETILDLDTPSGFIEANLDRDLLKVAVFDRHQARRNLSLGFLKGFGAKVGAAGTTTNLDENTLMIVGSNDSDMARCANALIEWGGGMAVVNRGQMIEKIEFPFGGIFSLQPWQVMGNGLRRIQRCLRENGSPFEKPIYALSFLTFVTLPSLRITARGLINAKERKIVSLFAD
jgi:adenine deaminase